MQARYSPLESSSIDTVFRGAAIFTRDDEHKSRIAILVSLILGKWHSHCIWCALRRVTHNNYGQTELGLGWRWNIGPLHKTTAIATTISRRRRRRISIGTPSRSIGRPCIGRPSIGGTIAALSCRTIAALSCRTIAALSCRTIATILAWGLRILRSSTTLNNVSVTNGSVLCDGVDGRTKLASWGENKLYTEGICWKCWHVLSFPIHIGDIHGSYETREWVIHYVNNIANHLLNGEAVGSRDPMATLSSVPTFTTGDLHAGVSICIEWIEWGLQNKISEGGNRLESTYRLTTHGWHAA